MTQAANKTCGPLLSIYDAEQEMMGLLTGPKKVVVTGILRPRGLIVAKRKKNV